MCAVVLGRLDALLLEVESVSIRGRHESLEFDSYTALRAFAKQHYEARSEWCAYNVRFVSDDGAIVNERSGICEHYVAGMAAYLLQCDRCDQQERWQTGVPTDDLLQDPSFACRDCQAEKEDGEW